ncbi:AMP-binding protein [Microbacterium resistens]|uniref:AMP-binding protein n=1 Tax=Microbacterium resistens TaxID=156977 RepID=UPI0037CC4D1D
MRLRSVDSSEPGAVRRALEGALDGLEPLALGFPPGEADRVPEGTAVVIATSGSTGVPKRVVLSADALRASAAATAARIGAGNWLLALPAGYVAGLQVLVRSILAGTDPVVLGGRFDAGAFADAALGMPDGRVRLTSLVPAQLATLVDAAEKEDRIRAALAGFDAILVGGQALPAPLRDRATALGARVVRTYGSSETSGGCVYDGVPLDGVAVRAVEGELWIGGPTLSAGYLGDPAQTADRFVPDDAGALWYRTGDLGTVDEAAAGAGTVRVLGRADNVIVSGGVNVSLDRVERAVRGVRGFENAVVLGGDDERWGQSPVVVVARADVSGGPVGGSASEPVGEASGDPVPDVDGLLARVRAAAAAEVGAPARPSRVVLVDVLPLLASAKPDREALRRLLR